MLSVIEISKGEKPEGNCIKFGGTVETDFYVKSSGVVVSAGSYKNTFIKDFENVIKRKHFEFTREVDKFHRSLY